MLAGGDGNAPSHLVSKTSICSYRFTPYNKFVKVAAPLYCHHSSDYTCPDGIRYVAWDWVQYSTICQQTLRACVGIEPINLLLHQSFEETFVA